MYHYGRNKLHILRFNHKNTWHHEPSLR